VRGVAKVGGVGEGGQWDACGVKLCVVGVDWMFVGDGACSSQKDSHWKEASVCFSMQCRTSGPTGFGQNLKGRGAEWFVGV